MGKRKQERLRPSALETVNSAEQTLGRLTGFSSGFAYPFREMEIKGGTPPGRLWTYFKTSLSTKAWVLYLALIEKAMDEESPSVTFSCKGAGSLASSRAELSSRLLITVTRANEHSPYVYSLTNPLTGEPLPRNEQRKAIMKALENYPVREYTTDEFVRVLERFTERIGERDEHTPGHPERIRFICPFHSLSIERYQKAHICAYPDKQQWHCIYPHCSQFIKQGYVQRYGNGGLVHFVQTYTWNQRRKMFRGFQPSLIPAQAREIIEQVLAGKSVADVTYTSQNVETGEFISMVIGEYTDPEDHVSAFSAVDDPSDLDLQP